MSDRAPLDLHDQPLYGPMVAIYARQRAELIARAQERAAAVEAVTVETLSHAQQVFWRTVQDNMSLCSGHAAELLSYGYTAEDYRPVWDDDKIAEVAKETGQRIDDVRAMHARYFDERCGMCGVYAAIGNRCQSCNKNLHPQWPAVYCSNRCALDDA